MDKGILLRCGTFSIRVEGIEEKILGLRHDQPGDLQQNRLFLSEPHCTQIPSYRDEGSPILRQVVKGNGRNLRLRPLDFQQYEFRRSIIPARTNAYVQKCCRRTLGEIDNRLTGMAPATRNLQVPRPA